MAAESTVKLASELCASFYYLAWALSCALTIRAYDWWKRERAAEYSELRNMLLNYVLLFVTARSNCFTGKGAKAWPLRSLHVHPFSSFKKQCPDTLSSIFFGLRIRGLHVQEMKDDIWSWILYPVPQRILAALFDSLYSFLHGRLDKVVLPKLFTARTQFLKWKSIMTYKKKKDLEGQYFYLLLLIIGVLCCLEYCVCGQLLDSP